MTVVTAMLASAGCGATPPPGSSTAPTSATAKHDHDHDHADGHEHAKETDGNRHQQQGHAHGLGPHQGAIADWGGGKLHVEFTVDHDQQIATVYVLGADEKSTTPIAAEDGKLLLTINDPQFQVELASAPQDGESSGKSSRFRGRHEKLGEKREFAGTISGLVDGTPYAGDFKE
ncbi:MAG: hypothetical protein ACKOU6_06785 [Planctomycetota bacterium]